ncbi:branched-chain amino acid ABC transporter permease [Devosia sediminis]|uniref:Branched-chain amino acid ABC transporter permease n=1 Tax=Devosia sediminis TaxID=2798801 RepID=A0A934IT54_9HYPH|nr:branched-chain amino acid ABC transporter permease [Devosia sediminis]MBJ3786294.1 branched-chain amino acid ABC transporter permease [Devosia sediminis]
MIQRSLALFGGLFVLILVIGWVMGLPFTTSRLVEAAAYALIALGLNIQWGYGGLFNFGIMGFLMVGGAAVTFISYPVNPAFWGSDGPMMLGRALFAFAGGALIVLAARQAHRIGITGKWRGALIVLAWFAAYVLYRSQIDPAAAYIESSGGGWVGGLGGHPILGWLFGGVLAAGIAYVIGKICLGLRTDYLAIATIGISEIIRALIKNMDWLTRGTLTVSPIPWPTPLPQQYQAQGMDMATSLIAARAGFLVLALVVLAIVMWLISRAYSGPWGRMMRAIRDNHISAASMGKNVTARQLEIFVFGSVLMGIGGAMLVSFVQIFDPSSYQPINHTFLIWVMVIVGGAGNNWGALFGAVLLWLIWVISEPLSKAVFDFVSMWSTNFGWGAIPEIEARSAQMRVFVLGLVVTIALRFAPKGLIPEVVKREDAR